MVPPGRAQAPLSEKMLSLIAEKHMDKDSPILARIFKEESEMEVWKQTRDGQYALLKTYPICRWSGALGPKIKQGDRQAPEGFYTVTPGQMNPNSSYYLAFNTGYPNAFDRAWGRTGSDLMVHGDCSSSGCYAMTDEQMQEIYALARESFFGGQKSFQLQAFPFRMTALNMAKHRDNPHFAFWKMLKQGYDHFNATHREPKVAVCEKRYVFDAVAPENASRALSFGARDKCPVYQLDPAVADAVLDRQRTEQVKMAEYIADRVSTVPIKKSDGGMNPVFVAKLGGADADAVAGSTAPGALPRVPNSPAASRIAQTPAQAPVASDEASSVMMANVPMPTPAPQAQQAASAEKPAAVANLFGSLFSGQTQETTDSTTPVELRGSNTDLAAKPRRAAPATKVAAPQPKSEPAPKAVARSVPEPKAEKPEVRQASAQQQTAPPPPAEMRSAFSAPPRPTTNGMLAGAQPVMPAGSFDARWSGLR